MHQSQLVKLFEDGVTRLVDGEDDSLASPGQPEETFKVHLCPQRVVTDNTKIAVESKDAANLEIVDTGCAKQRKC